MNCVARPQGSRSMRGKQGGALGVGIRKPQVPEPARRPAAPERSEGVKGLRSPRRETSAKPKAKRAGSRSRGAKRRKAVREAAKQDKARLLHWHKEAAGLRSRGGRPARSRRRSARAPGTAEKPEGLRSVLKHILLALCPLENILA